MALETLNVKIGANVAGWNKGLKDIQSGVKSASASFSDLAKSAKMSGVDSGIGNIKKQLTETRVSGEQTTRSLKSQAMSLAAQYRASGMSMSEALKKAWAEIERDSGQPLKGAGNSFENLHKKATKAFNGMEKGAAKSGKAFKNVQSGIKNMSSGFASLIKSAVAITGVTLGIKGLVDAMKSYSSIRGSVQRVNDIFMDSNKYLKYFAENHAKAFGMAETTAYEYSATYGNLFKGITASTEENAKVTIAMLKASAVISSKTGRTMEDVNERIRSGILGNTEAIEDLGINVPVSMLKTTKAFEKVAKSRSWESLTYQEQQQIRVLAILEQSNAQYGDSVSGLSGMTLPRLGEAFKDLTSYTGLFVTNALQPILDTLGKIIFAATNALKALSKAFGFKLEGNVTSAQSELTSGTEKANEALDEQKKKLSDLAGFDQINVLKSDSGGGNASSSGASGGAFDGIEMPELGMEEPDTSWADRFKAKLDGVSREISTFFAPIKALNFDPLIGGAKTLWEALKPLGKSIFSGLEWGYHHVLMPLAKWTIEKALPGFLEMTAEAADLLGTVISGSIGVFKSLISSFLKPIANYTGGRFIELMDSMRKKFSDLGNTVKNSGVYEDVQNIINKIGPIISKYFESKIFVAFNNLKVLVSNVFSAVKYKFNQFADMIGFVSDLLKFDLGGAAEHLFDFVIGNKIKKAVDDFKTFSNAVLDFTGLNKKAIKSIDVLGDDISDNTKKKVAPFISNIEKLDKTIAEIDYKNMVIDDSVVNDVKKKVGAISKTIINELSSDKNSSLAALAPLKKALGEEMYNGILADTEKYYAEQTSRVQAGEKRIDEILAIASQGKRKLTTSEQDEIAAIRNQMNESGIKALSESEVEYETIMRKMKDNSVAVSTEQAADIIKNAIKTRDKTIEAAEEQYTRQVLEAGRMREAGIISEEEYNSIVKAAKSTRDETISAANEQYDTIVKNTKSKLGENSRNINYETGEIKTRWEKFTSGLKERWSGAWDNISEKWTQFKTGFKRGWSEFWAGISNFFISIWNGIVGGLEKAINGAAGILNGFSVKIPEWVPLFGGETFGFNISKVTFNRVPKIEVPALATGGIVTSATTALIGEAGREAVLPLDRNTGWMDEMADKISRRTGGNSKDGKLHVTIQNEIDGLLVDSMTRRVGYRTTARTF